MRAEALRGHRRQPPGRLATGDEPLTIRPVSRRWRQGVFARQNAGREGRLLPRRRCPRLMSTSSRRNSPVMATSADDGWFRSRLRRSGDPCERTPLEPLASGAGALPISHHGDRLALAVAVNTASGTYVVAIDLRDAGLHRGCGDGTVVETTSRSPARRRSGTAWPPDAVRRPVACFLPGALRN